MGFVTKIADPGGFFDAFSGKDAAEASNRAADLQAQSGAAGLAELQRGKSEGQGFLQPFEQLGQQGLDQAGFLTDPQAQFDFLQNNPLFQLGLDNANTQTNKFAASRGRLSAGDTLQQLNQNALLTASPLIADQKNSIQNLLGQGLNVGQTQANTALGVGSQLAEQQTGIGNALAAGQVGAANAQAQGAQNVAGLAGLAASFFSDPLLKENVNLIGTENGFNIYSWDWNETAKDLGLNGSSRGVMANEVKQVSPEAITIDKGFMKVDYNAIGVNH